MIQLGYEPSRINLLTDVEALDFITCYPQRLTVVVNDLELPFIDRDSLISNKRATGRPQVSSMPTSWKRHAGGLREVFSG